MSNNSKAVQKYMAENLDLIRFRVPKGWKQVLSDRLADEGMSVNAWLNLVIRNHLGVTEEQWVALKTEDSESD